MVPSLLPLPFTLSCIIPSKNRIKLLPRALNSIKAQHPAPDLFHFPEILVVDDGSSDGTASMLATDFPEVIVVRTKGIGPGPARNVGAKAAKGDILFFLDSDDIWLPAHLQSLSPCFFNDSSFACSRAFNHNLVGGKNFTIPDTDVDLSRNAFSRMLQWCDMVPSAFAIRKDTFLATGGFPSVGWGEDWLFFLELCARQKLCFIPDITVERTLHTESLCTDQQLKQHILTMLDRLKAAVSILPGSGPENQAHFLALQKLASERGDAWRSIQDFYTAAKEAGLTAP
ncbi:glycosyltransferase family 2 protein [Desulfobotulus sp. H1]|uniref:Glycosyltransferase family 2 protein n=1 Tax=Desulfobotulus pelophilus TaxID=2823377 RepID=A0ABT3NBS7_9BACT|nr:glycosyltransferase family A protein [Desulfobotulus pelophilus]MCW7754916.1 glycosyltransferase family 2 protein [Desulfobotulus pelophilus]